MASIVAMIILLLCACVVFFWALLAPCRSSESRGAHATLLGVAVHGGVPEVVFMCWFGAYETGTRPMEGNRLEAFNLLTQNIGVPYVLVTDDNIEDFLNPHPAFKYLSGNHKADYARSALLDKFGGGYHDIKPRTTPWEGAWDVDDWTQQDDVWMYGVQEQEPAHIGYPPGMAFIQNSYELLASMNWIISKRQTPFTRELLAAIHSELDAHHEKLRLHPARDPAGYYSDTPFRPTVPEGQYPLRWLQLMGEISHPLMLKYHRHIKFGLASPDGGAYK